MSFFGSILPQKTWKKFNVSIFTETVKGSIGKINGKSRTEELTKKNQNAYQEQQIRGFNTNTKNMRIFSKKEMKMVIFV